jgi:lipopolysaccharide export system protein LptA
MKSMSRILSLVAGLAALSLGSISLAQESVSALKGHDANAPIDVAADRIEVQDRSDRAVFAGNVHVRQASLTLDTARLTVKSPSETARGNFGIYDLDRKLITLVGAVQLNRGGSQINGQRLTIDLNSGRAVVDGGPAGVGQSGGRVTGHFTVPRRGGN